MGFFQAVNPTSLFKSEFQRNASSVDLEDIEANANKVEGDNDDQLTVSNEINEEMVNAWRDLRVLLHEKEDDDDVGNMASREYLDARRVQQKSEHIGKNVMQAGLDKLVGLFLVEVERPLSQEEAKNAKKIFKAGVFSDSVLQDSIDGSIIAVAQRATVVRPEDPLKEGDIIWFAGSAEAIVDLRKVPGLESTQKEILDGVNENKFDRRLVQGKFSQLHLQSIVHCITEF
jgi:hypothetical protein